MQISKGGLRKHVGAKLRTYQEEVQTIWSFLLEKDWDSGFEGGEGQIDRHGN